MQNLKVIENESVSSYEASPNLKWYSEKIVDMVGMIRNETVLRKIYSVVKTHINILNEKEVV